MDRFNSNSENYNKYESWAGIIASGVIKKYNLCESKSDDYRSAARLGLIEACSRFNSDKGDCFEKYAYRRVKGAIIDAVRCDSHLSVAAYKYAKNLKDENELSGSQSQAINKIKNEKVKNGGFGLLVYQSEYSEDQAGEFNFDNTPEAKYELKQLKTILTEQLFLLSEEEREVIVEHYYNEKSLSQIGHEKGGKSRSWASRVHLRALTTLKVFCQKLEING